MNKGYIIKGLILILYTALLRALTLFLCDRPLIEFIVSIAIFTIGYFLWDAFHNRVLNYLYKLTGTSGKEKTTRELVFEFENTILPAHSKIVEANKQKSGNTLNMNEFIDLYYYWGETILFLYSNCFDNGFNRKRVNRIMRPQKVSQAINYRYSCIDLQHVKLIVRDLNTFLENNRELITSISDHKDLESYLKEMSP